jgi:predicted RNase H-like HicB family nuclease
LVESYYHSFALDLQGVTTDGKKNEAIKNALEAIGAVLESRHLDKEYDLASLTQVVCLRWLHYCL